MAAHQPRESDGLVLVGDDALRRNELRYRSLVQTFTDFVWIADAEGNLLTDIPVWRAVTGQAPGELLGSGWLDGLHPDDRERAARVWRRAVATRCTYDVEYRIQGEREQRWLHVRAAPVIEDDVLVEWIGTAVDVTAAKVAAETERMLQVALERERRTLEQVIQQAPAAVAVLAGPRHEFRYFNERYLAIVPDGRVEHGRPVFEAIPEALEIKPVLDDVLADGVTHRLEDVPVPFDDERSYRGCRYYDVTYSPLVEHGVPTGVLAIATETTDRVRRRDDLERQLAQERELAEQLQRALLPETLPSHPGVELAVHYQPASASAGVGGDWYDAVTLDDHHLLLAIGDVGGRGLPAATAMSQIRSATRGYAMLGMGPGEILESLSAFCSRTRIADIVTLGVGILDLRAERLTWASAGHLPPLLIDPQGASRFVDELVDPPLCADAHRYREVALPVAAGSYLVLYTDGVVEERDRSLADTMAELREAVPAEVRNAQSLCAALRDLRAGRATDDDASILICATSAGG